MTFLNSIFLFALPLIVVPLVLHFLKRKERKVVLWGAMRFLHEATTDSRRMRMPESLLLLLARCLLVAGLIFALARPLIQWGGGSSVDANRELIVIVDDSLSTARRVDGEPVFNRVRSAAKETISDSPANLPFQIMLASGGGRWIGDQPRAANSADGKSALEELVKQQPTSGTGNLMECVRKAMSAANERETSIRPRPAQRIVIVTDGMTPAWSSTDATTLGQLQSTIEASKLPVQIQVVEVESSMDQFRNLSVVQVNSETDRVAVKERVRLSAEIRNTGTVDTKTCRLAWKINDKTVGHSVVPELEPDQSTEVFWSTRIKKVGPVAVEAHLEQDPGDDLPEDSVAKRVLDVVKKIPILIVDNQSQSAEPDLKSQPITFLTSALGYDAEEASDDYHSIFAPTIVSAAEVTNEDLSGFDAIVVVGAENDSPELSDQLMLEVRRGCGVWVMIGSDPDRILFNQNWFQDGEGLSPLPLVETPDETESIASVGLSSDETEDEEIRIHPPSARHPSTRVLSDQQRIDLDQVTLQQHAYFQSLTLGDEISVPIRSNRGEPLVIENSIGQGRVLIQSFPISLNVTNWPVTNSFVVMVHEWMEYLAGPSARSMNLTIGAPLKWRFEERNERPEKLRLPDGTKIDLTEDPRQYGVDRAAGVFYYHGARLPGTYLAATSIQSETPLEIPFYIPPAREELLAKPASDEVRQRLKDIGKFEFAQSSSRLNKSADAFWAKQESSSSVTGGQPIWQWIVLALLGLLVMELVLAGRIGKRRGAVSDSASDHLNKMQQLMRKPGSGGGKQSSGNRKGASEKTASVG